MKPISNKLFYKVLSTSHRKVLRSISPEFWHKYSFAILGGEGKYTFIDRVQNTVTRQITVDTIRNCGLREEYLVLRGR